LGGKDGFICWLESIAPRRKKTIQISKKLNLHFFIIPSVKMSMVMIRIEKHVLSLSQ